MNIKNLMMWGVIVLLVMGLFQIFQNPNKSMVVEKTPFSEFLKNIDDGRVVQVNIKGNDIEGILSDGTTFTTDQSTLINSVNFTGNFVWVRAKCTSNTAGSVTKILYNN